MAAGGEPSPPSTNHNPQFQLIVQHPKPPITTQLSLVPPSGRHQRRRRPPRLIRLLRSISRTFPVFTSPKCLLFSSSSAAATIINTHRQDSLLNSHHNIVTGTIFGYRDGHVNLSVQENPGCLPSLVVELPVQTHALLLDMNSGAMRIAFECEKRVVEGNERKLLDEPLWSMFSNGKKSGNAVRREATVDELMVMETLKAVSTGAGVLPGRSAEEGPEGEMAYVRAGFQHVIGSRDSESMYMMNPEVGDDHDGPHLTIFFVRI